MLLLFNWMSCNCDSWSAPLVFHFSSTIFSFLVTIFFSNFFIHTYVHQAYLYSPNILSQITLHSFKPTSKPHHKLLLIGVNIFLICFIYSIKSLFMSQFHWILLSLDKQSCSFSSFIQISVLNHRYDHNLHQFN